MRTEHARTTRATRATLATRASRHPSQLEALAQLSLHTPLALPPRTAGQVDQRPITVLEEAAGLLRQPQRVQVVIRAGRGGALISTRRGIFSASCRNFYVSWVQPFRYPAWLR